MSTLVDRPRRGPDPRSGPFADGRVHLVAGALAAVQAATASLVVVLVPVVLVWVTAAYSSAPWPDAVRTGVAAWLLAHHAAVAIPGGHFALTPLGLTVVPVVSCWLAGVRLGRTLDPNAEAVRAGVGRARPVAPPRRALAALVLTYAGLVTLAGVPTTTGSVRPVLWQAFAGAVVVCLPAAAAGCAAWVTGGLRPGLRRLATVSARRLRLPDQVRCGLPAGGLAVVVHLAAGLVLLGVALGHGRDEALTLHRQLAPGVAGGLVLTLAQLAYLPDLVIWAGSWIAGPGFALGSGTQVSPAGTHLGPLPALPVLGALPGPGSGAAWIWAVVAVPVLAGGLAGWWLLRALSGTAADADRAGDPLGASRQRVLAGVATLAATTAVAWATLAVLASGAAGPGRLADVGPRPWLLGLTVGVETGAGALAAVGIAHALARLRPTARTGR